MLDASLQELEKVVWDYVETLRDSPQARMNSREQFYEKYGNAHGNEAYGFGDSEIAFLGWEDRSVLRPPGANPPGSAWWSEVNLWFIFLSELGAKAYERNFPENELPAPSQLWVQFIKAPNAIHWYRAHNASIIAGYLRFPHLASLETIPELVFINMVLYRLLFAQSMVEGNFIFPKLASILGDPRGGAVKFITGLDAYYPNHYPMTPEEIREVLGKAHSLGELGVKFLDDVLIKPELTHLFQLAAVWNNQPLLNSLINDHKPCYPQGIQLPEPEKGLFIKILMWVRKLFSGKPHSVFASL